MSAQFGPGTSPEGRWQECEPFRPSIRPLPVVERGEKNGLGEEKKKVLGLGGKVGSGMPGGSRLAVVDMHSTV